MNETKKMNGFCLLSAHMTRGRGLKYSYIVRVLIRCTMKVYEI